jgi:aspartate carbamoyltransferase regulatory subunit
MRFDAQNVPLKSSGNVTFMHNEGLHLQITNELYIKKIRDGTVIDHITAGYALDVLSILRIDRKTSQVVSVAMNVESKKFGKKDIVKVEGKELKPEEVDKIALIAPKATINIIRDYKVVSKKKVELPAMIQGILKCNNPSCISNAREPVDALFHVQRIDPLKIACHYCGRVMERDDVLKQY